MRRGGDRRRRFFRLLVRMYPAAHRRMFGEQMLQAFRDHYRDAVEERGGSRLRFWWSVLIDVGVSVVRERVAAARAWRPRRPGLRAVRKAGAREARRRVARQQHDWPHGRRPVRVARRLHYRRLHYPRLGRRPVRVVVRGRHHRLVYRGRIPELIAVPALSGSALAAGALSGRLGIGGLIAALVVTTSLAHSLRLTRPMPTGRGGDGPAPPGGASVREPLRPLPTSPAGCSALPTPGPDEPGQAIALI